MLEFNLTSEKLILFSAKAPQIKYMTDHFLTELKKLSGDHGLMKDEAYCQVMKQEACAGPGVQFQGIANACEQNLKRTFQYGGRVEFPNSMELKAMLAGRSSKRQLFLLPGGIERHLKIKTCSARTCVRPQTRREYILDIGHVGGGLWMPTTALWVSVRVIWGMASEAWTTKLYVTMHYNQVLPDFLKTLMSVVPQGKASDQQLQQISRLAALQHRAKDTVYLPTLREVQECVPSLFYSKQGSQQWLNMITQHMQQVQPLNPHQARAQFLGLVSAFPMFGSAFFYIQSSSSASFQAPCILAVNQNGLHFLNKDTHVCSLGGAASTKPRRHLHHHHLLLLLLPRGDKKKKKKKKKKKMMKFRFRRQGNDPQREKIKQELFAFNKPRYTRPINSSLLLTDTLGIHQDGKPAVGMGMGSDSREYQSVACRYITEKRLLQRGQSQK
ncbi:hypothetical protein CRUP_025379 [Coryphaenoides rupestris]|nr:hypothetical protein CRUP_025379 [Coryphaenoides rupestris]